MRVCIIVILLNILSGTCLAQEFKLHSNGLIYDDTAMARLKFIVDSMNLRYKKCTPDREYYGVYQTSGSYIHLDSGNVDSAINDIENGISFDNFCKKYPRAIAARNILALGRIMHGKRQHYVTEDSFIVVPSTYTMIDLIIPNNKEERGFSIGDTTLITSEIKNKWVKRHYENYDGTKEVLAIYFAESFTRPVIRSPYSSMIQYVDCMIDTNSEVFLSDEYIQYDYPSTEGLSDSAALVALRQVRVMGGCSEDERPREQAMQIAALSAKTCQWDIFLRSHLNLLNDNVARVIDGSYAQSGRDTYIKELEALNIDVVNLLLGICLYATNVPKNHYYASYGRVSRAISESVYKSEFEKRIYNSICDVELDACNRYLMYSLYHNYIYFLTDKLEKQQAISKLRLAVKTLPTTLREHIVIDEASFEPYKY